MSKHWTVLGGWAVPPQILHPVFGEDATYIDINRIMPGLIEQDHLSEDWKMRLFSKIDNLISDHDHIAGWSTGALLVLGLLQFFTPKEAVLISATQSFCRRANFRFGTRQSVIDTMIQNIRAGSSDVLVQFFSGCGIDGRGYLDLYDVPELTAGLIFLKESAFFDIKLGATKTLIAHGTQDSIIPLEAGRLICSQLDGTWLQIDGQHAFFSKPDFDKTIFSDMIIGKDCSYEFL